MIGQLIAALSSYLRVPAATFKYRLLRYHLITGLVSLVVGIVLVFGSWSYGDDAGRWLTHFMPQSESTLVSGIGTWIGRFGTLVLAIVLYKYIVLISVSPIMSPLSERIELYHEAADHKARPLSLAQWAADIARGVRIALRNIVRELGITFFLILISFVPGLAVVTAPLIFLVQAYYAGFGNMDYYLERHTGVKAAATYVREHKWLAIGNGAVFLLLLAIPFVGFFIAPALGATAATLAILQEDS